MQEQTIDNRYDRQQRIQGWDQAKLSSAKITIAGADALCQQVAISATALGFGTIEIYGKGINETLPEDENYDYSQGVLNFEAERFSSRAKSLEQFLKKINPDASIAGVNIDLSRNLGIIGETGLIIDATNNLDSKVELIQYAADKSIPLISIASDDTKAKTGLLPAASRRTRSSERELLISNLYFLEFNQKKQGSITSQFIAGIAVDEARKLFMPLQNEALLEDIIIYNLASSQRFNDENDLQVETSSLSNYRVLMIGAGALGIMAGIQLASNNIGEITIVDFDAVETTNLNRQVLHYDAVGQQKATSLARKLKQINPRIKIKTKNERITLDSEVLFEKGRFDAIIDGVDNNKTRALLNYFSLKYNIPMISAGTRYNGGQITTSMPGRNACLNCQADIDRLAQSDHRPASCIYAPTPSVITSNQIIGAGIVGELRAVLDSAKYGQPTKSTLKYAANEDLRVKLMPASKESCQCHQDDKMLKEWPRKMKHLYEVTA